MVIAGCSAAIPIGGVAAGLAVDRLGLTRSFMVFGVAYVLVTLTPLVGSSWSGLERRPAPPAGVPGGAPDGHVTVPSRGSTSR